MAREIHRTRLLDAFAVDLATLRQLSARLAATFDQRDDVSLTVEAFVSKHETARCAPDDPELEELPVGRLTRFTLRLHATGKHVVLDSQMFPFGVGIRSSSDSTPWCAGVNEVAVSFLRRHRLWYYLLVRNSLWWPLGIVCFFANSVLLQADDPQTTLIRWLVAVGLGAFFGAKIQVLTHAAIDIRTRRRVAFMEVVIVLGALGSVVAAIAAVIGLLQGS